MTLEMIACNLAVGSAAEKYPTGGVDLHIIPFTSSIYPILQHQTYCTLEVALKPSWNGPWKNGFLSSLALK